MSQKFSCVMQQEFEMSLLGELTFFLGLQVQQAIDGIFLSQENFEEVWDGRLQTCKYTNDNWV